MEKQDAFFLEKDTLFHAKPIGLTSCYFTVLREPNGTCSCSPFGNRNTEIHVNNKCNSYDFIQADNGQAFGTTAKPIDTQQNQAKSNY